MYTIRDNNKFCHKAMMIDSKLEWVKECIHYFIFKNSKIFMNEK